MLLQLCSCSEDSAELVVSRLPLNSFAALAATSKALHALVAALPQAVWRQAALADGFPTQHPLHQAPSVSAYLSRRHAVHASIRTSSQMTSTHQTAEGVVAADLSTRATLVKGRKVRLALQLTS